MKRKTLSKTVLGLSIMSALAAMPAFTEEPSGAAGDQQPPSIPGWDALVSTLNTLPGEMLATLPPEMQSDPQIQQEVARLILQALTVSAIGTLGSDGDYPVFLPGIGELLNVGQPNSDTIYKMTDLTPGGSYRLRGNKGSLNMAVIGQVGANPGDAGSDGSHPGATRNYLELATVETDTRGNFDILLSPEKPADYNGEWWQLHPKTHRLMIRQVSSDWTNQIDPTIAIERVDGPAQRERPSASQMEDKLRRLPKAVGFIAPMFVGKVAKFREEGYVNKLKVFDVSTTGGLDGQFYYEGAYDLKDNEALIVEAKHPVNCQYRSIILTNGIYQTTDWYNSQSSLNQSQASVDSDGMLRVVISAQDPGVANWLDTTGYAQGVIQGRWTNCDSKPVPTIRKVAIDQVLANLPAETATITAEERERILRDRRAAYQLRRHW